MVMARQLALLTAGAAPAEPPANPLIEQLDPPRRAMVLMALLGIVLVGVFLVAAVILGARWARRLARQSRGPTRSTGDIANRRLREVINKNAPDGRTDETTIVNPSSDDTIADP